MPFSYWSAYVSGNRSEIWSCCGALTPPQSRQAPTIAVTGIVQGMRDDVHGVPSQANKLVMEIKSQGGLATYIHFLFADLNSDSR
jgi:hypothetical protein